MNGKVARLNRITHNGKAVIIPMDHGTTVGPIEGLQSMRSTVANIDAGGASAIVLHKGIIRSLTEPPACGIIMHLSASTQLARDPNRKVLVGTVEEALRIGADAVSVHVNIGGCETETDMLSDLGKVAEGCDRWQMPLMAMMYPRGDNVDKVSHEESIAMVARIGAELGADIIKTVYTGNIESFENIVRSCPVPIVIAGGPKCKNDLEVLQMVEDCMEAGAIGVSLGRNAFQHLDPTAMVHALRSIIVEHATAKEALKELEPNDKKARCII
jgi:predicted phospho-2-dehydro-3-deoxyheptonate aldolase